MSGILLFILAIFIIIFYFGLSIVRVVFNTLFGLGGRTSSQQQSNRAGEYNQRGGYSNQQHNADTHTTTENGKRHKKVFDREDGEYVDFEEVE